MVRAARVHWDLSFSARRERKCTNANDLFGRRVIMTHVLPTRFSSCERADSSFSKTKKRPCGPSKNEHIYGHQIADTALHGEPSR
jgi:hypothetical protein